MHDSFTMLSDFSYGLHACNFVTFSGTDRSNFVQMSNSLENYPTPFNDATNMFAAAKVHWIYFGDTPDITPEDLAINMASSGYYR